MNITLPSFLDKHFWTQDDAPDIPSIDEIIAGIRMYTDFDIERNVCIWQFSYKPNHGAEPYLYKTELDKDEAVQRGLAYVDNMIDTCKRRLAEYAQSAMKKEKIEEEERMTNFKEEQVLNIMRKYGLNIELWPGDTHDPVKKVHICIQGHPNWPLPWTVEEKTIVRSYYCEKYGMVKFIEPNPNPPCAIRTHYTPIPQRGMDIPKVMKVETYNDRVVKVTFADGSFTKAVCGEQDTFDLDTGITVCLMKKMLGENGTRKYNDALRDIHKLMEKRENDKIEAQLKKEEARKKTHKADMKRKAKKLKAKEEAIDIQKQGIIRALQEMGIGNDGK